MSYHETIFQHTFYQNHSPLFKKYFILFKLLDQIIKITKLQLFYHSNIGRKPYSRIALFKAFIIKHLEGLKYVSQLIQLLKNNTEIAYLCGFEDAIPDDSIFYRFINSNYLFDKLYPVFENLVKQLILHNVISTSVIAIDSKPIKAYSRYNNFKFFNPASVDSPDKLCKKSNRNSDATLSYYSKNYHTKKVIYFWGYRIHCIISPEGIPIAFEVTKNNIPDHKVAINLNKKIKHLDIDYFLADAAYDNNSFYNSVINELNAIPLTPKNNRNSKNNNNSNSIICPAGLKMKFNGFVKEPHRCRMKFRCPIKIANKKEAKNLPCSCPINHSKFTTGKKYGCTKYIDPNSIFRNFIHSSFSNLFDLLYPKRFSVEQFFARLHNLSIENQTHFFFNAVRNFVCIANISQCLIALAAKLVINDLTAIRKYKYFAKNAPPLDKINIKLAA